ncbi:hypothetical protein [Rhodoligotrophos defluvii]|uniref:hypothetical protein n=1 Tax=Rhodoligotrophos defluvii TaxID=2561934 RepID=UPI0010C9E6E2|nr:hypothetical protein [Rhodoligotrophos defluvii]
MLAMLLALTALGGSGHGVRASEAQAYPWRSTDQGWLELFRLGVGNPGVEPWDPQAAPGHGNVNRFPPYFNSTLRDELPTWAPDVAPRNR